MASYKESGDVISGPSGILHFFYTILFKYFYVFLACPIFLDVKYTKIYPF